MKKFLSLILCVFLGVSLAGCLDETTTPETTTPETTTPEVPEVTATLQDVLDVLNADADNATKIEAWDYFKIIEEFTNGSEDIEDEVDYSDYYGMALLTYNTIITEDGSYFEEALFKTCFDIKESEIGTLLGNIMSFNISDYDILDNNQFNEFVYNYEYDIIYGSFSATVQYYNGNINTRVSELIEVFEDEEDESSKLLTSYFTLTDSVYVLTDDDMIEEYGIMEITLADKIEDCVVKAFYENSGVTLMYELTNFGTSVIELPTEIEEGIVDAIISIVANDIDTLISVLSYYDESLAYDIFERNDAIIKEFNDLNSDDEDYLDSLIKIMNDFLVLRTDLDNQLESFESSVEENL